MWDEAEKITLFGVEVYTYGIAVALGAIGALAMLSLTLRKNRGLPKGAQPLVGCLMLLCGFVFSRIGYCLMNFSLGGMIPLWVYPMVTAGGWSWFGALAGVFIAGLVAARILHADKKQMLDALCAPFLAFLCIAHCGEKYIENFGISRPLTENEMLLQNSFLAVEGEYNLYLATWLIEAVFCFVLMLALYIKADRAEKPAGHQTVLFLILFGMGQTLLESLRLDNHLSISFVGIQQVLAMVVLLCGGVVLAMRKNENVSKKMRAAAWISLPVAIGVCIGLEFAIDRTQISRYLLYAVYFVVLLVPTVLGIRMNDLRGK